MNDNLTPPFSKASGFNPLSAYASSGWLHEQAVPVKKKAKDAEKAVSAFASMVERAINSGAQFNTNANIFPGERKRHNPQRGDILRTKEIHDQVSQYDEMVRALIGH